MRKTLKDAFGLSEADATALALDGIDDVLQRFYTGPAVVAYNADYNQFAVQHYGISVSDAHAAALLFKTGTKGTKCFP